MYLLMRAWRSVTRNRHRSLLMCIQLTIGLSALTFTVGLWVGVFAPQLRVYSVGLEGAIAGLVFPRSPLPEEEEVVKISDVDDYIIVQTSNNYGLDIQPVRRIHVNQRYIIRFSYKAQTGRYLTHEDFHASSDEVPVVVSRSLSKYYPLGATLKLPWNVTVKVVGIVEDSTRVWIGQPEMLVDNRYFFISPLNPERELSGGRIVVIPSEDANIYEVIQRLRERWPSLIVYPMSHYLQTNPKFDRPLRTWLSFIALICLTVAAVGFGSSHFFTLRQRFREVGIQFALGANPCHFTVQIILEALILLAIPYIVSMGVGHVIGGKLVEVYVFELYETGLITNLLVLGISVLALGISILPTALWISRLTPAELLRLK
jgi:ABC-type antimicrobial peptide transport system permease subunit